MTRIVCRDCRQCNHKGLLELIEKMNEEDIYNDKICIYCHQELVYSNGVWFCPDCKKHLRKMYDEIYEEYKDNLDSAKQNEFDSQERYR